MENFSGPIGNRIRDFAACSAVLQPTALPPTLILRKSTAFGSVPTYAQLKLKRKQKESPTSLNGVDRDKITPCSLAEDYQPSRAFQRDLPPSVDSTPETEQTGSSLLPLY